MSQLEPTYLRYVYDGLLKGSLNSQNSSSLPNGFIGLFEQEFSANISMVERRAILKKLGFWALFKGTVSSEMASLIFNESEDDTKALIDKYSKWFNSPSPGKYSLYHDRLRAYLLQKLGNHELKELNEKLISYLEKSLEDHKGDESEIYALEHLSTHMLVESQLNNNFKRFHEYVNNEVLWPRQISASKEYKWSQNGVQQSIKEAARRHNEDSTLESMVNSVKIKKDEESNIGQIIDYLKSEEIDIALNRIDNLPSNTSIKFIILLLMIHELTIGSLKKLDLRISYLKTIIKKIELYPLEPPTLTVYNNLNPETHLKGNYSTNLLLLYCIELKSLNINFKIILDKIGFSGEDLLKSTKFSNIDLDEIISFSNYLNQDSLYYKALIVNKYLSEIKFNDNQTFFDRSIKVDLRYSSFSIDSESLTKNSINIDENLNRYEINKIKPHLKEIILNCFSKREYYSEYRPDNSKNDLLTYLLENLTKFNLLGWVEDENLAEIIFKDFKNFCLTKPEYSYYYAAYLCIQKKTNEALKFLKFIELNFSIPDNYEYNHSGDEVHISFDGARFELIKFNKNKEYDSIIEEINDPQMKSLVYLHLIYNFGNSDDKSIIWIDELSNLLFNFSDLEKGKKTNSFEYQQNILITLYMSNYFFECENNDDGFKLINQAFKLIDLIFTRIFHKETIHWINNRYRLYSLALRILQKHNLDISDSFSIIISNIPKREKIGLAFQRFLEETYDILGNNQRIQLVNSIIKYPWPPNAPLVISISKIKKMIYNISLFDCIGIINSLNSDVAKWFIVSTIEDRIKSMDVKNKINIDFKKLKEYLDSIVKFDPKYKFKLATLISNISEKQISSTKDYEDLIKNVTDSNKPEKQKLSEILGKDRLVKIKGTSNTKKQDFIQKTEKSDLYRESINLIEQFNQEINIDNSSNKEKDILLKSILDNLKKLKKVEERELKCMFYSSVFYYDNKTFDKIMSEMGDEFDTHDGGGLMDKRHICFKLSLMILGDFKLLDSLLEKLDETNSKYIVNKIDIVLFKNFKKKNKSNNIALNFLRDSLAYSIQIMQFLDAANFNDNLDISLKISELLCVNKKQNYIVDVAKDMKDSFNMKKVKTSYSAPITGIEMPSDVLYELYRSISKYLYENEKIEESFEVAQLMQEKNIIAQFYISIMMKLCNENKKDIALKYSNKVLGLISQSKPLPIDNSPWPFKQMTLLYYADFLSRINEYEKSYNIIKQAIDEVDSEITNKKIEKKRK